MTKKVTVKYWATAGSGFHRTRHYFEVEVRQDMWDSLSESGRTQFVREQMWDQLECGYCVVDTSVPRNHE